ncbi:MAG: DUF362 domain-containing protein [Candidatus Lokiarchaeota archaeon]|nr:DUF362 domain-containing protein [Candidatus Lokiarchaeota archaeon]
MTSKILIEPVNNIKENVANCFNTFGGVNSFIKGNVFLKINCTMPNESGMTNSDLVVATIEHIVENCSNYGNIFVCDNSAVGSFTRMTFLVNNLAKRIKKAGAKPLYLDEKRPVNYNFNGKILNKPIPIPEIIHENLIKNKENNTYINLPKLKSHIQCRATICIKNHHGFLYDNEKIFQHHKVHQKVIDIINVLRPDFNIVDATNVCDYGPIAFNPEWHQKMGLLISGIDPVAVDTIGCKLIGIDGVKHISLASEEGLGCNDLDKIEVLPSKDLINDYKIQLHHDDIPTILDSNIRLFKGAEKCCIEGCYGLGTYFRLLVGDKKTKHVFGIMGKGHQDHIKEFDDFSGPFIIAGPCAVNELKDYFENREDKNKIKVFYLNEHMDIKGLTNAVLKACNVSVFSLADKFPFGLLRVLVSYLNAKLHGVKCNFL